MPFEATCLSENIECYISYRGMVPQPYLTFGSVHPLLQSEKFDPQGG